MVVDADGLNILAEKIDILATDRDRLAAMKIAARRKAELHPWRIYRQRLVEMAREVMEA